MENGYNRKIVCCVTNAFIFILQRLFPYGAIKLWRQEIHLALRLKKVDQTGQNLSSDAAINFIHSISQPEKDQTAVI